MSADQHDVAHVDWEISVGGFRPYRVNREKLSLHSVSESIGNHDCAFRHRKDLEDYAGAKWDVLLHISSGSKVRLVHESGKAHVPKFCQK